MRLGYSIKRDGHDAALLIKLPNLNPPVLQPEQFTAESLARMVAPVGIHFFKRLDLDALTAKPLKITGVLQRSIQSRRADFQLVGAMDKILDIKHQTQLATKGRAIIQRQPGRLVDKETQNPALTFTLEFKVDQFKTKIVQNGQSDFPDPIDDGSVVHLDVPRTNKKSELKAHFDVNK